MKIVATGRTGNLASAFPSEVLALKTRLEASVTSMAEELRSLRSPDVLIHSAALVPVQKCNENPQRTFDLNVGGSERWFRAAHAAGVKKFIYISTSHVFKPTEELKFLEPGDSTAPVAIYGESKLAGEVRLREIAHELPGTELLILRVFSLLSRALRPGFLFTEMHRRAREQDFSPVPGFRNLRDFIFAEDACARILTIAKSQEAKGTMHVCTGKPLSVRDIAEGVFKEYGLTVDRLVEAEATINSPRNCLVGRPSLLRGETSLEFSSVFGDKILFNAGD